MSNNAMSFYFILKKVKKPNLEILPNGNKHTSFVFCSNFI
jgi:hypothetical protein